MLTFITKYKVKDAHMSHSSNILELLILSTDKSKANM